MSDNDDLLGDDLGDQSLADYNLGNEEEEQLLADDYDGGASQNVPPSVGMAYGEPTQMVGNDYSGIDYGNQPEPYVAADTECVVPNIIVEVPNMPAAPQINTPLPEHSTYAPYEPPRYEVENAVVPPAIPAAPIESPQIVPSEMHLPPANNGETGVTRERFTSERPPNQRTPQVRDIPDTLDKVYVPRGGAPGRARTTWRNPQLPARPAHPYRRHHLPRGNFNPRQSFPPPQHMQSQEPPQIAPEMPPRPQMPQEMPNMPHPQYRPERPMFAPNQQRFNQPNFGPNIRPMPFQYRPQFNRPFGPNMRQTGPNNHHMPQVTIRQPLGPNAMGLKMDEFPGKMLPLAGREPEVRMLPVQLPNNLPPGGLAGKKVLINPHFKGNFQPPVEGLTYIPTRIPKSPPIDPTLEHKFAGPIKDIDDAAERFIAEQRSALARAATRNMQRKSPQRFIENTTIEIANELAATRSDDDLLRRQEEFINANRAGLRRRMRSPTPPRRSPSPPRRRSPPPRHNPPDEESEYRRRVREQESLRERVLRAKEVRRRKNAVTLQKQLQERQRQEKETARSDLDTTKPTDPALDKDRKLEPLRSDKDRKPEVARSVPKSPERERSPPRPAYEDLTPPREITPVKETPSAQKSPERNLTPPLPVPSARAVDRAADIDLEIDELDMILGDIDGILSDDEDTPRVNERANKQAEAPLQKSVDLRSRLPPRTSPGAARDQRAPKQRIVFNEDRDEKRRRDKSPPAKKAAVEKTSPPAENNENVEKKQAKAKQDADTLSWKMRQRITYENKQKESEKEEKSDDATKKPQAFVNRRVVLQRKVATTPTKLDKVDKSVFSRIEIKTDPTKPNPGIFSRAVRTAIGADKSRIVLNKKQEEPQVEYESDSDIDEEKLLSDEVGNVAVVVNLPHGMTDTRLKTLAGNDVQNVSLDKEERSARISFKTTVAAEGFKKKFNNKMVAASRLTVTLK